jgi:hypothetical protein
MLYTRTVIDTATVRSASSSASPGELFSLYKSLEIVSYVLLL